MTIRTQLQVAAWLSLFAALYATLLPFEFRAAAVSDAWAHFIRLEFPRHTAPTDRQQWISNALLFIPLGFFWTGWLTRHPSMRLRTLVVSVFVALLALLTTATVEFAQYWMPRRATSLVDMSANLTGGVAGVVAWHVLSWRLKRWLQILQRPGMPALKTALVVYTIAYLFHALLPFDFMLSARELAAKLDSDLWGVWRAPAGLNDLLRWPLLRCLEVLATVPIGVGCAWSLSRAETGGKTPRKLAAGLGIGFIFGLLVQALQFATVSGVAQGASVACIGLGMYLGFVLFHYHGRLPAFPLQRVARPLVALTVPPYLLLVAILNLAGDGIVAPDPDAAVAQLTTVRLLPFYYHYRVAESVALQSVMLHIVMYAPIGAAVWLWSRGGRATAALPRGASAALFAVMLAVAMETGKLFMPHLRPDATSLIIAGGAAFAAWKLCGWLWAMYAGITGTPGGIAEKTETRLQQPRAAASSVHDPVPDARPPSFPSARQGRSSVSRILAAAIPASAVLAIAATWSVATPWLVAGLFVYAVLLWHRPESALLIIPALVPVLDFSLWRGMYWFDELDLFLLMTAAVLPSRRLYTHATELIPSPARWAFLAFLVSVVVSLGISLFPLSPIDDNTWIHYASPYHGLRVAKGVLWAVVLAWLLHGCIRTPYTLVRRWLVPGMVAGLALAMLVIFWERATYPGLFDFDSRYRITGLFTDMRVGGPSIETYLVMSIPFVVLWAYQSRPGIRTVLAAGLMMAGLYGLILTYSRAGYAGLVISLCVMVVAVIPLLFRYDRKPHMVGLLVASFLATILMFFWVGGGFLEQRMKQIEQDFGERWAHWSMALDIRPEHGWQRVFGAGTGSFPAEYTWRNPDGRVPGNFSFVDRDGQSLLRLGVGDSLFMNQRLHIPRDGEYTVTITASANGHGRLRLYVCEKHIRHSYKCRSGLMEIPSSQADSESRRIKRSWHFDADGLDTGPWLLKRQLAFSLSNASRGDVIIDIDRLSLRSVDGREWLQNGDFASGARHWYFTTDHHWPWRIENQFLEILFDQGWFGLTTFVILILVTTWHLATWMVRGSLQHACLLASIAGILTIGLFSTVFWSPRISMLFYLMVLLGTMRERKCDEVHGIRDQP